MLKNVFFFLRRYFQNKRVSNLSHTLNHSVQLTNRSVFFLYRNALLFESRIRFCIVLIRPLKKRGIRPTHVSTKRPGC